MIDGIHVQDMGAFGEGKYLAAGGLMHMNSIEGTVHLLEMNAKGEWMARKVFESHWGVPRIVGRSKVDIGLIGKIEALIVFTLDTAKFTDERSVFGVSEDGAVHYLGQISEEKKEEQPGGK